MSYSKKKKRLISAGLRYPTEIRDDNFHFHFFPYIRLSSLWDKVHHLKICVKYNGDLKLDWAALADPFQIRLWRHRKHGLQLQSIIILQSCSKKKIHTQLPSCNGAFDIALIANFNKRTAFRNGFLYLRAQIILLLEKVYLWTFNY